MARPGEERRPPPHRPEAPRLPLHLPAPPPAPVRHDVVVHVGERILELAVPAAGADAAPPAGLGLPGLTPIPVFRHGGTAFRTRLVHRLRSPLHRTAGSCTAAPVPKVFEDLRHGTP